MNAEGGAADRYYAVSPTKLVVMSICTFGVYQIGWAWRCWEYIRARDERRFNPFWRSVYVSALVFNFRLFWEVDREAGLSRRAAFWRASGLGSFYLVCWVLVFLLENTRMWPIALLGYFALVPVQRQIERINARAGEPVDRNGRFSATNVVAALVGGIVLLSMIGRSFAAR